MMDTCKRNPPETAGFYLKLYASPINSGPDEQSNPGMALRSDTDVAIWRLHP